MIESRGGRDQGFSNSCLDLGDGAVACEGIDRNIEVKGLAFEGIAGAGGDFDAVTGITVGIESLKQASKIDYFLICCTTGSHHFDRGKDSCSCDTS